MQKYISQLNEAQQEPVLHKDGPMIIIAGAGSGKTSTPKKLNITTLK